MKADIHPLRRWLFERRMTIAEFARESGVTPGFLSEVMNYQKPPSLATIGKITAATDGELDANAFMRREEN